MTDTDIIKKALDVLVLLNTAIKNVRLYPPASASIANTIDRLHLSFLDLFCEEEQVIFAESEKAMLICGHLLSRKDQEKPHAASLLNMLLTFGLKSISFCKGLEKDELTDFINLLSRKPESLQNEGGLTRLWADQNVAHILLDQKVYVAMDKDHQILAGLDISDDQITQFFMLTHPDMDPTAPQFREMARNPEALSKAFEAGLSKMMAQKETLSSVQLSENLNNMLSLLDKIAGGFDDKNRGKLSRDVGQALLKTDPAMAEQLTTQNMEHLLGGLLLQYLTAELTQSKLGGTGQTGDAPGGDSKSKLVQVAEKFSLRLQDTRTLLDEGLMTVLPKIIEQLVAQKEHAAMESMLERLAANLTSESAEVRTSAARSLADIIESLPGDRREAVIENLSGNLTVWLQNENIFSAECPRICGILKDVAQNHIRSTQFSEAIKYLQAFNAIIGDAVLKTVAARNMAQTTLDELASTENIDILLNEIDSPQNQNREDTGRVFAALGDSAVNDVLDLLRATGDSDERVRIMHLIASAKEKALPLVASRIKNNEPWYYLRNLAYLLGQIGNEDSARALAPLLLHENDRLRQEALKSIYRSGGNQRGSLLIKALPQADEEFKCFIVEALGQSKSIEAVPSLVGLLKNRPMLATATRINLEEKICIALSAIGSPDAIVPLSEIAETKSFLGLRSYHDKVKGAASKALTALRRKVAESGPETA